MENNATEKFQTAIIDAVNEAATNAVHPALIYTILGGCQADVLNSIKRMAHEVKAQAAAAKPPSPAGQLVTEALDAQPKNVVPLPQTDSN